MASPPWPETYPMMLNPNGRLAATADDFDCALSIVCKWRTYGQMKCWSRSIERQGVGSPRMESPHNMPVEKSLELSRRSGSRPSRETLWSGRAQLCQQLAV